MERSQDVACLARVKVGEEIRGWTEEDVEGSYDLGEARESSSRRGSDQVTL